jgi:hypothetical protein
MFTYAVQDNAIIVTDDETGKPVTQEQLAVVVKVLNEMGHADNDGNGPRDLIPK